MTFTIDITPDDGCTERIVVIEGEREAHWAVIPALARSVNPSGSLHVQPHSSRWVIASRVLQALEEAGGVPCPK